MKINFLKTFIAFLFFITIFIPNIKIHAEEDGGVLNDTQNIIKAKVIRILESEERNIPGTEVKSNYQKIEVLILDGDKKGETKIIENDYLNLKEKEKFYLLETISFEDETTTYMVYDKIRLPVVLFFVFLFLISIFIFGGIQGIRGLVSLIGSMILIIFILMPGILNGYSPILVTVAVSSLIIVLGSYITHGFNKTTTSAVVGMIVTVLLTGVLAFWAVKWAGLSGFESEESIYLNWNTGGNIDFVGLLFGGIMIGLLGVLYDVAIGQAISVEELREAGRGMSRKKILERAIRIGKEHTGALVNTLAIAYVGASLPLLLLFYGNTDSSLAEILNREIFATEIIRTIIGSIGLVLAVPITSIISVMMLVKTEDKINS